MNSSTKKSCLRGVVVITFLQIFFLHCLSQSEARDLRDVLVRGFPGAVGADNIAQGVAAFAPTFSQAVAQAVTQEFPLASVSPAFTYRFNPTTSVYEPSTNVPGPLFSERALTLGKGQWNFSVGYSYVDFSELNGVDLDNIRSPVAD